MGSQEVADVNADGHRSVCHDEEVQGLQAVDGLQCGGAGAAEESSAAVPPDVLGQEVVCAEEPKNMLIIGAQLI